MNVGVKNNKKGFAPIFIVLIVVVAIALGSGVLYYVKNKSTQPSLGKSTWQIGNEISLTGNVLENHKDCASDGNCVLVVQTFDGKKFNILYGGGLTPNGACYRSEGFQFGTSDDIEVFGKVQSQDTLSVCGGGNYYLRKIGARAAPTQSSSISTSSLVVNMAGWKIYQNEKYGFEMQYPLGWIVSTSSQNSSFEDNIGILSPERQKQIQEYDAKHSSTLENFDYINPTKIEVAINVYPNPHNYSVKDYFGIGKGESTLDGSEQVDGVTAYDVTLRSSESETKNIIIPGKNSMIVFALDSTEAARHILSTFRFISPASTTGDFYDKNSWKLTTSIEAEFNGAKSEILLLKSIKTAGESGVGDSIYDVNLLIAKDGRVVYNYVSEGVKPSKYPGVNPTQFYMDDTLNVRDVTNDGVPEIIFHSGFMGASDSTQLEHILHYVPNSDSFVDLKTDEFYDSLNHELDWVDQVPVVTTSVTGQNTCHTCPQRFEYDIYRWNQTAFVLSQTITGTKEYDGASAAFHGDMELIRSNLKK